MNKPIYSFENRLRLRIVHVQPVHSREWYRFPEQHAQTAHPRDELPVLSLDVATSCQKLSQQFSFSNLAWPITDKNPWPNTNPSHKLQKDYGRCLFFAWQITNFSPSFLSTKTLSKWSPRTDLTENLPLCIRHLPFWKFLLLFNAYSYPCRAMLFSSKRWPSKLDIVSWTLWENDSTG